MAGYLPERRVLLWAHLQLLEGVAGMSFLGNDTFGARPAFALLLQSSCIIGKGKRASVSLLGDSVCICSVVGSAVAPLGRVAWCQPRSAAQGSHLLQLLTAKLPASLPPSHRSVSFGFKSWFPNVSNVQELLRGLVQIQIPRSHPQIV